MGFRMGSWYVPMGVDGIGEVRRGELFISCLKTCAFNRHYAHGRCRLGRGDLRILNGIQTVRSHESRKARSTLRVSFWIECEHT